MRKLNITSYPQPSPMVRLELEYLTERAAIRHLAPDEEQKLLQRIRSGDVMAIYLLVNSQEFMILKMAKQHLEKGTPVAEMVAAARTALTALLQNELANPGLEHYELYRTWAIRQAIMQVIYNPQPCQQQQIPAEQQQYIALHKTLEQHTPFLNRLNRKLKEVEARIVSRATTLLQVIQPTQAGVPGTDSNDVMEARVSYYRNVKDDKPVYTFFTHFTYREAVVNNDFGMLHKTINQTDWHRESYMLPLEEPYCYLLYDLIERCQEENPLCIHQISRIDMSAAYREWWDYDLRNGKGE